MHDALSIEMGCIYCGGRNFNVEHCLPAGFGAFANAPTLARTVCAACNSKLGRLDEHLLRTSPEGFLRYWHDVRGRSSHSSVNPFVRGSAGGKRLSMVSPEASLDTNVWLEVIDGKPRQMCQLIVTGEGGPDKYWHSEPLDRNMSSEELSRVFTPHIRANGRYNLMFDPKTEEWAPKLVQRAFPTVSFSLPIDGDRKHDGAVVAFEMKLDYFRALAKIGFHYFLSQFPSFRGDEQAFARVRDFIFSDESRPLTAANNFVAVRHVPLLAALYENPRVRPTNGVSHFLVAEIRNGVCLASFHPFFSKDVEPHVRTISLGYSGISLLNCARGHAYIYDLPDDDGRSRGKASAMIPTRIVMEPIELFPSVLTSPLSKKDDD